MKRIDLQTIIVKNSAVVQKELNGVTYLMNPNEMTLHTLNDTAAFLWKSFKRTTTVGNLVKSLTEEYPVDDSTARKDISEFVAMYIAHGMLQRAS